MIFVPAPRRAHRATLALAATLVLAACTVTVPPGAVNVNAPGASASPGAVASAPPATTATGSTSPKPDGAASPLVSGTATANLDFASAAAVTLGQAFNGKTTTRDQYFKVAIPAGTQDGRLLVTLAEGDSSYVAYAEFFDAGKTQLTSQAAKDGTSESMTAKWDVAAGKAYYVKVAENAAGEAPFTLTMAFEAVKDANERNDDFDSATAIDVGKPIDFAIFAGPGTNSGSDTDTFKVTAPAGKTKLKVAIKNKSTAADPAAYYVDLLKADKESLGGIATGANALADVEGAGDLPEAGVYYLKVTGDRNSGALSTLTVTLE